MKNAMGSLCAAAAAVVLGAAGAAAGTYQPMDLGDRWEYSSATAGVHVATITREEVVLGVTTRVRSEWEPSQEYENYWTSDAAGNVYLHGARNLTYAWEAAYTPPILWTPGSLSLHQAWTTRDIVYSDLQGTARDTLPAYPLAVFTEGMMTEPLGSYFAYGFGFDESGFALFSNGRGFDLLGRSVQNVTLALAPSGVPTDWVAEGVGVVEFLSGTDDEYHLVACDLPTVVERSTWGAMKRLFVP